MKDRSIWTRFHESSAKGKYIMASCFPVIFTHKTGLETSFIQFSSGLRDVIDSWQSNHRATS